MYKKGSHVEIVLSFVIFITFLTFLYIVLEPAVKTPTSKESLLEIIKPNLIDYISEEVSSYTLTLDFENANCDYDKLGSSCFIIQPSPEQKNAFVKEKDKENYKNENGKLSISCEGTCDNGDSFAVFFADEFNEGKLSCVDDYGIGENCYSIIFQKTKEYIFKSKVEELKEEYNENINILKKDLGVSNSNGFWFNFTDNNKKQIIAPEKPEIIDGVDVYLEEIPVSYIGDDKDPENKQSGFLEIMIW